MKKTVIFVTLASIYLLFNTIGCNGQKSGYPGNESQPLDKRDNNDIIPERTDSSDAEIQSLIAKLNSPDAEKRASAAFSLGEMGPKAATAIPYLIETLKDTRTVKKQDGNTYAEMYIMFIAKDALVQIGEASLEPLINAFLDQKTDHFIRQNIATTLGDLRDPRAIEPLLQMLSRHKNKDWDVGALMSNTAQALAQLTGITDYGPGGDYGFDYREFKARYEKMKQK